MENKSKLSILTNGLIKENPVLVLVLGTCPTLATSTSVVNGFGMGVSVFATVSGWLSLSGRYHQKPNSTNMAAAAAIHQRCW